MRLLLLFMSILFTTQLYAQGTPDNKDSDNKNILGGNVNFNFKENNNPLDYQSFQPSILRDFNDYTTLSLNINPYYGRQINRALTVGAQVRYEYASTKQAILEGFTGFEIEQEFRSNQYSIGLFGRYLFNPASLFNFYIQAEVFYINSDDKLLENDIISEKVVTTAWEANGRIGVMYSITDSFRILSSIGAITFVSGKSSFEEFDYEDSFSSFGLDFSLSSIFLGAEYIF